MYEGELCTQNKSIGIWTVGLPGVFVHFLPPHFPLTLIKDKEKNLSSCRCKRERVWSGLNFTRCVVNQPHLPQSKTMFCLDESDGGGSVAALLMKNAVNGVSQQRTFPGGNSARQPRSFMHWADCHGKEMARRRKGGHVAPPPETFNFCLVSRQKLGGAANISLEEGKIC